MPESVRDRPTKSHEYVFLLTKSERYYYDADAIREPHTGEAARAVAKGFRQGDNVNGAARRSLPEGQKTQYGRGHSNYFGADGHLLLNPTGRNRRTVWTINSQPFRGAHFAVMPQKLAEPCILAGTSEHGACSECGAPWERVVERTKMVIDRSERAHELGRTRASGTMVSPASSRTIGWAPTCACVAGEPVPPVVLDPFSGAGTTGLVALRFGRDYVGIEPNPEYAEMSRVRIIADRRATKG